MATSGAANISPEVLDLHCYTETNGVITTTMFDIPGYRIVRVLGTVYGLTVRARNWAAGLGMVAKSMIGGELKWFTTMVRKLLLLTKIFGLSFDPSSLYIVILGAQ